jgi:hypothetical protein
VEAQPHRVQAEGRRGAGLSDHRFAIQRPGHHVDVRQPVPATQGKTEARSKCLD